MKVLLDESIPRPLGKLFPDNIDVSTVQDMGWSGTGNGDLLRLVESNSFKALITVDRGFQYQHNLEFLPAPVIILIASSIHLQELRPLVPKVVSVLTGELKCEIYCVHA